MPDNNVPNLQKLFTALLPNFECSSSLISAKKTHTTGYWLKQELLILIGFFIAIARYVLKKRGMLAQSYASTVWKNFSEPVQDLLVLIY